MKRVALALLFGLGFLAAATGPALATDQEKFAALVLKFAPVEPSLAQFKPQAMCVCNPGGDDRPGVLFQPVLPFGLSVVLCYIPSFDSNGKLDGLDTCAGPWVVLTK